MPNIKKRTLNETSILDDDQNVDESSSKHKIQKISHQKRLTEYFQTCKKHDFNNKNKNKKTVRFDMVNVYYFQRTQGYQCIPNTGTATVGMSYTHDDSEDFTIDEYVRHKRETHLDIIEKDFYLKKELIMNLNKKYRIFSNPIVKTGDGEEDEDENDELVHNENFISSLNLKKVEQLSDVNLDLPINMEHFCPILTNTQRTRLIRAQNNNQKIDDTESFDIKTIRKSREVCGCTCKGTCDRETCECMANGIGCQVDKTKYPCSCSIKRCKNPFGLKNFDQRLVRKHYDCVLYALSNDDEQYVDEKKPKITCLDVLPYEPFDLFKNIQQNSQIACLAS